MKKYMIVAVLVYLCLPCRVSAQEWRVQNSGTSANLNKICFVDSIHGWAVGENSTIVHTTDGGVQWMRQQFPDSNIYLQSVFFIDSLTGHIVGRMKEMLHTTDGGAHWTKIQLPTPKTLRDVYFSSHDTGWAVGGSALAGIILRTYDGGNSWQLLWDSMFDGSFAALRFISNSEGWIVGLKGFDNQSPSIVLHTVNSGASWEVQPTGHIGGLRGVSFHDSLLGWAAGPTGLSDIMHVIKTTDGGNNWYFTGLQAGIGVYNDFFYTLTSMDTSLVLVGSGGAPNIYRSVDGGKVWSRDEIEQAASVNSISCTDALHCWACGGNGRIWKYIPSLLSVHEETSSLPDDPVISIAVSQRGNVIDVAYTLNRPISIATDLYDLLGKKLDSRNAFFQGEGSRTCSFDVHDYPGGVYYILSTVGSRTYVNSVTLSR
ncbi:MAG: hypothetical protein IPP94_01585 [Ignavibacteria bacterium]|nr:hypothetical protein [Ignavibacteria bacterium]